MTQARSLKRFLAIASLLHPSHVPLGYFRSYGRATPSPKWLEIFHHHGRWSESRYLESLESLKEDCMIQIHNGKGSLSITPIGVQHISELCKTRYYDLVKEASAVVLTHLATMGKGNFSHSVSDQHILECLDHVGSQSSGMDEYYIPVHPVTDLKHVLITAQLLVNHDRLLDAERFYSHAIQLAKSDLRHHHWRLVFAVEKLVRIHLDRDAPSKAEQFLDDMWRLLRMKLGPFHLATLAIVETMAIHQCSLEKFAAGEQLFRLILNTRPAGYKQNSSDPEITGDIAGELLDQSSLRKVCVVTETPTLPSEPDQPAAHLPLLWRKWDHDSDTPSMAITLLSAERNLGLALVAQSRNTEAWEVLTGSTRSAIVWLSSIPKIAISCIEALSICASWKGLDRDALKLCSEAHTLAVSYLGPGHSLTGEIYISLSIALQLSFRKRAKTPAA